jgi:hypothetical protein
MAADDRLDLKQEKGRKKDREGVQSHRRGYDTGWSPKGGPG